MNLKQFEYVLTLNKEGCFSKAAEVLNISQPSLSQYIKKLENELGVILFDRTGGNVHLTDAGRVYVEAGKKILDIKHDMALQFMDIAENKTGTLVVGTTPYRSAVMMPWIVKEFKKLYPGITVVVEEHNTEELLNGVLHGDFDICITVLPEDREDISFCNITSEEFVLAVPKGVKTFDTCIMSERKYSAIDVKALNGCGFITVKDNLIMQKTLNKLCNDYNISVKAEAVVNSLESQIALVRSGVGMTLVPTGIETLCNGNEVDFYSFKQELPKRLISAVWQKNKSLSGIENAFLSVVKEIKR